MTFLKSLKFKNKKAAAFGCYGWSGESVKILQDRLKEAGFEVVENNIRSNWNPSEEDLAKIPALVTALIGEKEKKGEQAHMDKYQCPCGYVYDPEKGDPTQNVAPGTACRMDIHMLNSTVQKILSCAADAVHDMNLIMLF